MKTKFMALKSESIALAVGVSLSLLAGVSSAAIHCESSTCGYIHCDAFFSGDNSWDWQHVSGPYSLDSPNGSSHMRVTCWSHGLSRIKNLVGFTNGSSIQPDPTRLNSEQNVIEPEEHDHFERLTFDNGETLEVVWRNTREPPQHHVEPPFADDYDILKELVADGDSNAAMSLYELSRYCSSAYVSEAKLENAVELAYQTHQMQLADMDKPVAMAETDDIDSFVQSALREPFEDCKGITTDQRSDGPEWLETAANLGHSLAAIEVGRASADTDYDKSHAYLWKAWQQGNTDALTFLARLYGVSYQSGTNPENEIKAYAAFYAFNYLLQEGLQGHGEIANRWAKEHRNNLRKVENTLQDYEIEEGRKAAKELIKSNDNCCMGI